MNNTSKDNSIMTAHDAHPHLSKRAILFSRIKRRFLKNIWLARLSVFALIVLVILGIGLLIGKAFKGTFFGQIMTPAKDFIFASSGNVKSTDGRTNIIILGRGGEGHDAPELTDTLMFGSVSPQTHKASLISIPRDLWVESLQAKINSAYYWGNKKQSNGGLALAKATIEEVIGQNVHYAVIVDFSGFKKIIDELGGVEVEVPVTFTDTKFPIVGRENDECGGDKTYACRYETIHFEKGKTNMDGETALKFVRSRHAQGDEGTDFARSRRQQAVIDGIKNKILNSGILFNPDKVNKLIKVGESVIETDIPSEAAGTLARFGFDARDNVTTSVIPEDLLVNPPISSKYQNQYVFVSKDGNWKEVQDWVKSVLP